MDPVYKHITIEQRGDVACVRLLNHRLPEQEVHELAAELQTLVHEHGCRRLALSLGPQPLSCLYSLFLATLLTLQRQMEDKGGHMAICQAGPEVRSVFQACRLDERFRFLPDFDAAVAHWATA